MTLERWFPSSFHSPSPQGLHTPVFQLVAHFLPSACSCQQLQLMFVFECLPLLVSAWQNPGLLPSDGSRSSSPGVPVRCFASPHCFLFSSFFQLDRSRALTNFLKTLVYLTAAPHSSVQTHFDARYSPHPTAFCASTDAPAGAMHIGCMLGGVSTTSEQQQRCQRRWAEIQGGNEAGTGDTIYRRNRQVRFSSHSRQC
jgi:hypothetical protein